MSSQVRITRARRNSRRTRARRPAVLKVSPPVPYDPSGHRVRVEVEGSATVKTSGTLKRVLSEIVKMAIDDTGYGPPFINRFGDKYSNVMIVVQSIGNGYDLRFPLALTAGLSRVTLPIEEYQIEDCGIATIVPLSRPASAEERAAILRQLAAERQVGLASLRLDQSVCAFDYWTLKSINFVPGQLLDVDEVLERKRQGVQARQNENSQITQHLRQVVQVLRPSLEREFLEAVLSAPTDDEVVSRLAAARAVFSPLLEHGGTTFMRELRPKQQK